MSIVLFFLSVKCNTKYTFQVKKLFSNIMELYYVN